MKRRVEPVHPGGCGGAKKLLGIQQSALHHLAGDPQGWLFDLGARAESPNPATNLRAPFGRTEIGAANWEASQDAFEVSACTAGELSLRILVNLSRVVPSYL